MTKRILMIISIAIIITMVGCSQQSIEVVTTTKPSTTVAFTSATTTTVPSTTTTTQAWTTTVAAEPTTETTTKLTTIKQTTTRHTTTVPRTTSTTIKMATIATPTTSEKVTTKSYCKGKNDHWVSCGNMSKWYNTRDDLKADYSRVANIWNTKYRNGEIDWDAYVANCPQGYECWSCPGCGKWTGNYH